MVVMEIVLDATSVTPEDMDIFLEGGVCVEARAVLNRNWEDYLSPDLVEGYGGQQVQIQWLETDWTLDETPNNLWLTVKYSHLTVEALQKRYEEQNLEVGYQVLYSRDVASSD